MKQISWSIIHKNIYLTLFPKHVALSLCALFTGIFLIHATHLEAQIGSGTGSPRDTDPDRATDFLSQYWDEAVKRWSHDIEALEQRDVDQRDPKDAILFIGSSSIRRWESIETDMAPYQVVQRGYGGAKYSDLAVFSKRLIHPHKYSALVVFVANDVQGKSEDHSCEEVEECIRHIVKVSRAHRPQAPIFFIEITPTRKRFSAWPLIREVNARIQQVSSSLPNTYFISTAEYFLDPFGNPRDELFVDDQLHLNNAGYEKWSVLIRRDLDKVLR